MRIEPPLTAANFYDPLPTANHRTGDIWRDLPTFDNLGRSTSRGVVITPACDLANRKAETITYLPVITAKEYLVSPAFRFECWQEIYPVLSRLEHFPALTPPTRYQLVSAADLSHVVNVKRDAAGKALTDPEKSRLMAYLKYVEASVQGTATVDHLQKFIKSDKWNAYLNKLVTNALKPDVHFLPKDGKPAAYSAISEHSVVLFRYPLSIPIASLEVAQSVVEAQWATQRENCKAVLPTLRHMPIWPIKLASLRGEFLGDMLSRYVNMFIRLGSSDFSERSVQEMSIEIGGVQ